MITIEKYYPINMGTERADFGRRANFRGRTRKGIDFLFETVRGYRGPRHPTVTEKYALKIERLARAAGLSVSVREHPKPTKAKIARTVELAKAWVASRLEVHH